MRLYFSLKNLFTFVTEDEEYGLLITHLCTFVIAWLSRAVIGRPDESILLFLFVTGPLRLFHGGLGGLLHGHGRTPGRACCRLNSHVFLTVGLDRRIVLRTMLDSASGSGTLTSRGSSGFLLVDGAESDVFVLGSTGSGLDGRFGLTVWSAAAQTSTDSLTNDHRCLGGAGWSWGRRGRGRGRWRSRRDRSGLK